MTNETPHTDQHTAGQITSEEIVPTEVVAVPSTAAALGIVGMLLGILVFTVAYALYLPAATATSFSPAGHTTQSANNDSVISVSSGQGSMQGGSSGNTAPQQGHNTGSSSQPSLQ